MHSSDKPPGEPEPTLSNVNVDEPQFEQTFGEVEGLLQNLRQRYVQVQTAKQKQPELKQRLNQLQRELHQVKEQLETLEVDLESRLFSWRSQREVFWQIVRFAGLGFVFGQILNACSG